MPAPEPHRPRVLVADDDQDCASVIQQALLETIPGIEVAVAFNGWQLEQAVQSSAWTCMLVDLRLGGRDGVQLLEKVRREHPGCTRILMSAHLTFPAAMDAVNRANVFAVLPKPIDLVKLTRTVQAALGESLGNKGHQTPQTSLGVPGRAPPPT